LPRTALPFVLFYLIVLTDTQRSTSFNRRVDQEIRHGSLKAVTWAKSLKTGPFDLAKCTEKLQRLVPMDGNYVAVQFGFLFSRQHVV